MEKRQRRILFPLLLISAKSLYPAIRELATPAAVSRQERSDRVSEEASYPRHYHYLPYAPSLHVIPAIYGTFADTHTDATIVSQYTLR